MTLSKQYSVRKSDICILRYNGKSLFRCFGYSKTNGYKILGGLFYGSFLPQHRQVCLYIGEAWHNFVIFFEEIDSNPWSWMIRYAVKQLSEKNRKSDRLLF